MEGMDEEFLTKNLGPLFQNDRFGLFLAIAGLRAKNRKSQYCEIYPYEGQICAWSNQVRWEWLVKAFLTKNLGPLFQNDRFGRFSANYGPMDQKR